MWDLGGWVVIVLRKAMIDYQLLYTDGEIMQVFCRPPHCLNFMWNVDSSEDSP